MSRRVSRARLEAVWGERLARQSASGLSIAEFCRREGITASSFHMWCRRHGKPGLPSVDPGAESARPANFIDIGNIPGMLGAADPKARVSAGRIELRLDLGGGIILQLVRQ